ncbi:hypothetical protein [Phaeovulum sp. W22_SRMD_FR3]|uniref:hypothetical protein n=1 Tax=Phaeovulum sp. W22_SRMD_FR3 TaxID=3240274 RepID=UPI003F9E3597
MSAIQPISDASAVSHLPAISSGSGSVATAPSAAKAAGTLSAALPAFAMPSEPEPVPVAEISAASSHSVQLGVSMAAALAADNAQATSITTPLPERAVRFQPVSPLIPPYYPSHVDPNLSPAETEASTRNTLTNVKF